MASSLSIVELAEVIQSRTRVIEKFMTTHSAPIPSFQRGSSVWPSLPESLSSAREEVLDATDKLNALLLGSLAYLMRLADPTVRELQAAQCICLLSYQVNVFTSLHLIHRYKVAQNVDVDEEVQYDVLAQRVGLDVADLRRFLRLAIAHHIFCEPQENIVSHNATSRILIDMPGSTDWVGVVCEEMLPAGIHSIDALTKWPSSEDPGHTGYALANRTEQSLFYTMMRDPLRAKRFANAMSFI